MKRYAYLLVFCALALAVFILAPHHKRPRNIILIGWDAASRGTVRSLLAQGRLPNLKALVSRGALVDIDAQRRTDTAAGWAEILTGYPPEDTGVCCNAHYQAIPQGYTVFERLKDFFGKENFVTLAAISKKHHMDCTPAQKYDRMEDVPQEHQGVVRPDGRGVYFPGAPFANAKGTMDVFANDLRSNDRVLKVALKLLEQYRNKPFFFFIHFGDIDGAGHQYGGISPQVNDAIISCDTCLGALMQKLKEYGIYDKTLLYITADHGLDKDVVCPGHHNAALIFLATNNARVIRRGTRIDITPTILDDFGIDLGKIRPELPGRALTNLKRCRYCIRVHEGSGGEEGQ
ncbi:MAG TPA: alkaline phosphatase family protein [Patescibacteria group bacterium]|nr:alkaline phosphatase family protein [Patescibacteria group bacterium]